jgi:hypothetical protein
MYFEHYLIEQARGFYSPLYDHAFTLVRAAAERPRPNEQRLREFRDSALPSLTQGLFSKAPVHKAFEEVTLAFSLAKVREQLGPDHPIVRKILGRESPESLARAAVRGSRLDRVEERKRLWEGGQAAIDASTDPMIRLARLVDPDARAVRKRFEDQVEAVEKKGEERIAQAHSEVRGTGTYPDATFTLRLTYGKVEGYRESGRWVPPLTTLHGLYERATPHEPFALPPRWLAAKPKLELATPMNFASTCDIIGGNSGSPVLDREGRAVGLIFDGNIQSLGGAFWFDPAVNRSVAVESSAILEALRKVYGAERVVKELVP